MHCVMWNLWEKDRKPPYCLGVRLAHLVTLASVCVVHLPITTVSWYFKNRDAESGVLESMLLIIISPSQDTDAKGCKAIAI